jgi:ABC-type transport system involved in multi-copper enzyme maturation permease subunit
MNPLVKKEIRLLLPAWIAATLLAVAPAWVIQVFFDNPRAVDDVPPPFFIMIGMLFLGIASFGQEFSFKTFSFLLAQPVERQRVWWTKIFLLTIAFVSTLGTAFISWILFVHWHPVYASHFLFAFKGMPFWVLVFLSGGLWTALLLRQAVGAFWFTLLTPAALFVLLGALSDHYNWSEKSADVVLGSVFTAYPIAGFFWAQRMFYRAQDAQWMGGNIFFPWRKRFSGNASAVVPGGLRNRFVALVRKEIQLHEVSLFIAVTLFGLHVGSKIVLATSSNSNLKIICEMVWSLWLLMPLLIGSTAVAEERRLGVLEPQMCLPVSRGTQLSTKFFVGLILSLMLGAVVPSVIEHTRNFGITHWVNFWGFIAAAGIYFVSFYASTLARSTLQAIGFALGIPVVVWAIVFASAEIVRQFFFSDPEEATGGWRILALGIWGWLFLPLILARLMFWNFRWLHQDWKLWRRNAAVVAIFFTLVVALTSAVYFRTWEFFQAPDYPHGAARLNEAKAVKLSSNFRTISAILPGGRLWSESLAYDDSYFLPYGVTLATDRTKMQFANGSNWMDVASGGYETLAVKSDGSLWCALKHWQPPHDWTQSDFTQIGSDTNWLRVATGERSAFLLLKTDGSLWIWGTNRESKIDQKQVLGLKILPVRISNETNWIELLTSSFPCAKKSDGSIWGFDEIWDRTNNIWRLGRETNWDVFWIGFNPFGVAIGTNGELWVASSEWTPNGSVPKLKIQLGRGMKWKAATLSSFRNEILALRDDGTLWKSSPLWQLNSEPKKIRLAQLGNHSDWIALPAGYIGVALAADGSLWLWGQPSRYLFLAPSRKPVYLGNIFGKAD